MLRLLARAAAQHVDRPALQSIWSIPMVASCSGRQPQASSLRAMAAHAQPVPSEEEVKQEFAKMGEG